MPGEFRRAIQPDFADVRGLRKEFREECQLGSSLMRELRMQSKRRVDSWRRFGKRTRSAPRGRRRRNAQYFDVVCCALTNSSPRIRIEIEMTVKVDHLTVYRS